MGVTTRQFKALTRKNFINWKRQPKCSFVELCCPAYFMLLMVLMRCLIDTDTSGVSDSLGYLTPTFPAFVYNNGEWVNYPQDSTDELGAAGYTTVEMLSKFYGFTGYTNQQTDSGSAYVMELDINGPLWFNPSDCQSSSSVFNPPTSLPLIGYIDDGTATEETNRMVAYFNKLVEFQSRFYGKDLYTVLKSYAGLLPEPQRAAFLAGLEKNKSFLESASLSPLETHEFASQDALDSYLTKDTYAQENGDPGVCFAFKLSKSGDSYTLTQYFNGQQDTFRETGVGIPKAYATPYESSTTQPDYTGWQIFLQRGYATVQNLAAQVILQTTTKDDTAQITLQNTPFPVIAPPPDDFEFVLSFFLGYLLLLIFIPPVYNNVFMIVKEKESRTKESMRMMGMKDRAYWLSWYVYYTVISTVIAFISWFCLIFNVIVNSNTFLLLLAFIFYAQSVFGEIVFLQTLFSKSKYAGIVATVVYYGCFLLGIPASISTDPNTKAFFSLFPQAALSQTMGVLAVLECESNTGLQFGNMFETVSGYSYGEGLIYLLFDAVAIFFLGVWLDYVLPKEYGERKKCCFCCTCCCKPSRRSRADPALDREEQNRRASLRDAGNRQSVNDKFELKYLDESKYEPVAPEVARLELDNQYLKVADLTKTYPNGFKAVNGINVKMYNGQIFSLLGHNGAGKSTTISMLTGLLPQTSGEGQIFDLDLFEQMDEVRQLMGVCPQHDVLFDLLTPEEHLDIFYDFKGGDPARKVDEITSLIVDVGVAPDKNKKSMSLSGGNKRKLSVAIAMCGNSRLVLLDEPTAGMDLSARRSLWDMLKNYKNNRIIILTTHYMDEADVLGDRIGIMAKGQLMCLGSSLFLKNRFGAGYKLTMVKKYKTPNKKVGRFLEEHFGDVELLSEVSQEITFKISYEQAEKFEEFFALFDQKLDELDLISYGISMTTLEEVFLAVNGDEQEEQPVDKEPDFERQSASHRRLTAASQKKMSAENLIGQGSAWETTKALLKKRFHIYKRDRAGLCCEVFVPVLVFIFGMLLLKAGTVANQAAITLDTSAYPKPQQVIFGSKNDGAPGGSDEYAPSELQANFPDPTYFDFDNVNTGTFESFYDTVGSVGQQVPSKGPYLYGAYEPYVADKTNNIFEYVVATNATSAASPTYFQQYLYESILQTAAKNSDSSLNVGFTTVTQPYPNLYYSQQVQDSQAAGNFGTMVSIALALIPCVIISFIIMERTKQLKHMQLVSGVSLPGYWLSNMLADLVKTYIPMVLIIAFAAIFKCNYEGVWLLFLCYPLMIVPFTYCTSFLLTNEVIAQILTIFFHFLTGGILPSVAFILQFLPSTAAAGDALRWAFVIFPNFNVVYGILVSATNNLLSTVRDFTISAYPDKDLKTIGDLWAFENLTGCVVLMLVQAGFYCILLAVIELDIFQCCARLSLKPVPPAKDLDELDLDDDVIAEEQRLDRQAAGGLASGDNEEGTQRDFVVVNKFRKAYTTFSGDPFLAVERVSFGLDYGECFALLGVNGAGKSTTFKSLTRDILPTSGDITIGGYSITSQFDQARKLIGYCPQHDAVFPLMSVEEHLWLYSRIKGIPVHRQQQVIEDAIEQLNLADHRNKPAGTLSGGNKRKLSVGMAIVGNPPIILLDEPSAGMDPEARRFMWTVVERISQRDKKSAVILTSHSMEEAEALSTKMGIMVRGGLFRCFGSSQHIKNKFATGYEIEVKIRKSSYAELEQLAAELGMASTSLSSRTNLQEAKDALEKADKVDALILDQLRRDGMGSDLFIEANLNNGDVRMQGLLQFLFTHQNGFKLIRELAMMFPRVEVIEQCGDFYKLRVPKEDKTIGFIFGKIQSFKQPFNVQEYAVQQTSLEQIFQNFANQSIDEKAAFTFQVNAADQLILLNPDRKATQAQHRMSTVGRKSLASRGGSRRGSAGTSNYKYGTGSAVADNQPLLIRD